MSGGAFVLISAAYNEEKNIGKTIESVIRQTTLPSEWNIVSDGSVDGTDAIVREYSRSIDFIRFFKIERTAVHSFSSKVRAINLGLDNIRGSNYGYIGILDTDISLESDYFSRILEEFERDDRLGIAGGNIVQVIDGALERRSKSLNSVAGAIQLFRKACFLETGGFTPMEYGGEDAAIEIIARMKGWKVRTFPRIEVLHYGYVGGGTGSRLSARYKLGERCFALGYHMLFQFTRLLPRLLQKPYVIGSIAEMFGFLHAKMFLKTPLLRPDAVRFLRDEQLGRLRNLFRPALTRLRKG
jgi:poly-beta-1,6-N-acetyl-D-glucosamine synthase